MRHRKAGLKLSRKTGHLNSMFRNLVTSLLKHDRICTTDTKAKELRRWADHIVTLAKRGDLHARRQALTIVQEPAVVHAIFAKAAERFGMVNGGYTRITKMGFRPGDRAPLTLVELIGGSQETKKKKKRKPKTAPATAGGKKEGAKETSSPASAAAPEKKSDEAVQPSPDHAQSVAAEKAPEKKEPEN
jgi:large subunit ribosomal protein L17